MKGGHVSAREKLWIALLGVCLWVIVIVLAVSIGLDLWITKSADGVKDIWVIGLWKACLRSPTGQGKIALYSVSSENCTTIMHWNELYRHSVGGGWDTELELLSLVFASIACVMAVLAHLFYICGYIPRACCKTCGMAGLPAVLFTSGAAQVCCLVTIYFMAGKEGSFGPSYYLTIANLLPTWVVALATSVVPCRLN